MALSAVLAVMAFAPLVSSATSAAGLKPGWNYQIKPAGFLRGHDGLGLAVKPGDTNHIVQVNGDWITAECEYGASFDGGKTWTRGVLEAPDPLAVTCDPLGHGPSAMDQSIAFGTGNRVYTAFGATPGTGQGQSVVVARSTDGGKNFATAVVAMPGGDVGVSGPAYRFPKLLVDPASGGDHIYVVAWDSAGSSTDPANPVYDRIVVAKSTDGGQTFSAPSVVSDPAVRSIEPSQLVKVGDNLHVVYRTHGHDPAFLVSATSTDDGATWTRVNAVAVKGFAAGTTQFPASSFPRLAADGDSGDLYVVYQQVPNADGSYPGQADHFIGPDADILFIRSSDGGTTWTKPAILNDPPVAGQLTQNRHPNIAVADNGRIDVTWHDRRHSFGINSCPNTHSPPAGAAPCKEARLGDTYYTNSTDGGATWSDNRRITDRSINNDVGFDYRFGAYWDFGPVPLPLGGNELLIGWMDSRLGNVENDNLDIFLAKINANKAAGASQTIAKGSNTALAIALSKETYPGGGEAVMASTFATKPWTRVVIVNKADHAWALAGSVLARAYLGPVLLAGKGGLSGATADEVERLQPTGAFVLGDESKLSQGVVNDLKAAGVPETDSDGNETIIRIAGADAAGAAAQIATTLDRRSDADKTANKPAFDAAIVVNPERDDAAAAAVLASNRRLPILFSGKDSVPQATSDALAALDITTTFVVGSSASVGDAAMAGLPGATRLGGTRVAQTSRAVGEESIARQVPYNMVFITDNDQPMHAALIGAAAGRSGGLLLQVAGAALDAAKKTAGALGLGGEVDRFVRVLVR